jgi:hypothetical protein
MGVLVPAPYAPAEKMPAPARAPESVRTPESVPQSTPNR